MTVGYITSEYPHPKVKGAAGIGTSIKNLSIALVKKGIKVIVFVYHQNTSGIVYDEGVEIHLIVHKAYTFFGWYLYRKLINAYVNNIILKENIVLIEAPDWTGITAFMRFKVPLIIRFHGSDAYFCKLDGRQQKIKNYWFEKLALQGASGFIAPTTYAGEETAKIFKIDRSKIKTIHYGLQIDKFINSTPLQFESHTLLYIGTIIRKKGVLQLAEIFNKVIDSNSKAKLILIGSDAPDGKTGTSSTYQLVENLLTAQAKQQTTYLGKIPYEEVKHHIKNAHVCTFPSFAETLGMVTIESMALQKPIVNTSIGWAQELIDDGVNGYLVHPADIDIYAKTILKLFNDTQLCIELGKSAREKVEHTFDILKQVEKNISYYKSILK